VVLADHGAVIPSRREAFRYWLRLGLISFGGPIAQVAIMHRELVEERRWVDERTYLNALNLVILLPGPEALQLAIWLGWRLHGVMGGVVAGLCFLVPSVFLLLALSFLYAVHGDVPLVAAAILGLKATAIALIVQAVVRISGRALKKPLHWLLAGVAFVLMVGKFAPFPLVVAGAAVVGLLLKRQEASPPPTANRGAVTFPWRTLATGFVLWAIPAIAVLQLADPDSVFAEIYRFFTTAALVTFGGAYAILAWVNQQAVDVYGWLTQADAVAGLALAETTPGPLIIVLQFVGFMAGWNQPGTLQPGVSATIASMLASWAIFLPSFVFILVGAPYGDRLASNPRIAAALVCMTAAVAGVIGSLAIAFGRNILFPTGFAAPEWNAIAIAAAALALLQWSRIDAIWIIIGGAVAGLALGFV
jgi:chromate transporter